MPVQTTVQVNRLGIAEAQQRIKEVVFVDARSATALKRIPQEIPGAIHVPLKQLEANLGRLPRDRTLVTYCT